MTPEEKNPTEESEQELYSRSGPEKMVFHELAPEEEVSVKEGWGTPRPVVRKGFVQKSTHALGSIAKSVFSFSLVALVVALAILGYMLIKGSRNFSNDSVDVRILGSSFSDGGAPLPLSIEVTNRNSVPLVNASIAIEYQKENTTTTDPIAAPIFVTLPKVPLGTIEAGKTASSAQTITLYGEQNSSKIVRATLEYQINNSNGVLTKVTELPVTISRVPIVLSVEGDTNALPNQPVTLTITALSNTTTPIQNLLLRVDYPSGFVFTNADVPPAYNNNIWLLGDLAQGAERSITIHGTVKGFEGEDRAFRVTSGVESATDKTEIGLVYNSLLHTISLEKSFLAVQAAINGSPSDDISLVPGTTGDITLTYTNTLDTRITDAELRVKLSGNAYDSSNVSVGDGFFSSANDTIIFDKSTQENLAIIEPGASGVVHFSLKPLETWSGNTLLQNPTISFIVDVSGRKVGYGSATSAPHVEQKTIKYASRLQLTSEVSYATGAFANIGPIPPKAEVETTYTVTIGLKNSSGTLSNTDVRATLPIYATYKNKVYPSNEDVTFDPASRTVVWKVGKVDPGVGLILPDRSISIQIGIKPSKSQIGSLPNLLLGLDAKALDVYTGLALQASRGDVSAFATDVAGGNGKVTN